MKKRYDATMRELFDPEPAAWLEFFGVPVPDPGLAQVIDSNVSTVTAETDKLMRRGGPEPVILYVEFLSGRNTGYPHQAFWYNTLAGHKHGEPVWSVLVLLRVSDGFRGYHFFGEVGPPVTRRCHALVAANALSSTV